MNMNKLQTNKITPQSFKNQAKKIIDYAKENPTEVLLACLTLIMMDANESLDSIEQLEEAENARY